MARYPRAKKLVIIAVLVAILGAMYPLQGMIEDRRYEAGLANTNSLKDIPPGEFFGTVLIGGFRAIAVDLIWLKAREAERNREWHRLKILNSLIASLQPRFVGVWKFNMWNMAYNLSTIATSDREGWRWVKEGINFGKEGFERNPNSWELAWDIGHHYYHRCGDINDSRTDYYQQRVFEETGKTNWQHALTWFKKANEAAARLDARLARQLLENLDSKTLSSTIRGLIFDDKKLNDVIWSEDAQNLLEKKIAQKLDRPLTDDERQEIVSFITKLIDHPDRANPNWLGMIAATYRKIAYEAEEKGDEQSMIDNRLKAIEWLNKLKRQYPLKASFVRYATGEAAEIAGRLQYHRVEKQAEQAGEDGNIAREVTLLSEAAQFWMKLYQGNPYIDEQIRHLESIAGRMHEVAANNEGELKARAENLELDVWLTLLSGPEATDEQIHKCETLNEKYTDRLDQAMQAGGPRLIISNLDKVLQLRKELYAKDPLSDKYVELMKEIALTAEKVIDDLSDVPHQMAEMSARNAWLDLLKFEHKQAAEPGLARLRSFVDETTTDIAEAADEKSEVLRQKVVEILSLFYMQNINRDWAEQHLRTIGGFYTNALAKAVENGQDSLASDYYRRSKAIWKRILQLNPDDVQAKDNLNRIDKIITIVLQKNSIGM